LHCTQMGVEHGSPRIQQMFKRTTMGNDKILETAAILAKYADRTAPPQYDVIYDLAYETLDDRLATLRLIAQLPKPYKLQIFSIIYYPGTALHALAERDGLIMDEKSEIYDRMFFERHDSYTSTLLFMCRTGQFPHQLLKALTSDPVVKVMTSDYLEPAGRVAKKGIKVLRRIKNSPFIERTN